MDVLHCVLEDHQKIDVLKIDIETLERDILLAIPESLLRRIKAIYIEQKFENNPLQETHSFRQYGSVAQFLRREQISLSRR